MDTAITGHTNTRGGAQAAPSRLFHLGNPGLANLLVTGGTRLEREQVALALHRSGRLRLGPFVALRAEEADWTSLLLPALSPRPALDRTSPLARAEGGTLFVDDIDLFDHEAQRLMVEFLKAGRSRGSRDSGWAGLIAAGARGDLHDAVLRGRFLPSLLDALDKIRVDLSAEHPACPELLATTSC